MKIKKKEKMLLVVILIIVSVFLILLINTKLKVKEERNQNHFEQYGEKVDKNQVAYKENTNVEELKNEVGATGNADIYEIEKEYDGRNIITVKPSIKYKVAFAGMIKKSKPNMNELDNILNQKLPKKNGIWIEEKSREKILELFNNKVNSKYTIDNEGYLKIESKNNQNDNGNKIEKIINGDKQYILDISSICYIVDDVTGEILDYNFENMDKYQTYEYFEDNDKIIVFITQNKAGLLTDDEIFDSIIKLL